MDKLLLVTAILWMVVVSLPRVESSQCRGDVPAPSCSCRDGVVEGNGRCTLCSCTADGQPGECCVFTPCREYTKLGCWTDIIGFHLMPSLEGTDPRLDGHYSARENAIEKCYQVALSQGMTLFAVQDGGWCFGTDFLAGNYGPNPNCAPDGEGGPSASQFYGIHGPDAKAPCETVHAGNCSLATSVGYGPPGNQPCNVTLDIHEGVRSIDNPLQVHQCGNIIINALVSFQCDHAYKASVQWTVRESDTQVLSLEVLPDDVIADKLRLDLPPNTLPAGLFMVQVTVTMKVPEVGHTSIGVAQTWLNVLPFPIVARLNGYVGRTLPLGHFYVTAYLSHTPRCQIPSDQLSYNWTCEAVSYPNPPVTSEGIAACEALLGTLEADSDPDGGTLHFDTSLRPVPLDSVVKVRLVIAAEGHEPGHTYIDIHTNGDPSLGEYRIVCLRNCNPGDLIAHETLHLIIPWSVDNSGPNSWTFVEAPADFPGIDWTNDILLVNDDNLQVRPNVFTVPGYYTVRATNYFNENFPRIGEFRFLVIRNPVPPRLLQDNPAEIPPDVCSVLPAEGVSLLNKFCIVCEDFYDEVGPLKVDFKYKVEPGGVELATVRFPGESQAAAADIMVNLFSGWVFYTPMLDLAPGSIIVEVLVSSADGRFSTVQLDPVFVDSPTKDALIVFTETFFDSRVGPFFNLMSMRSSAESFSSAVTAASVVATLANNGIDISQATDMVADGMAKVELQDYDGIIGLASCILLVTVFPQYVSGNAQVHSSMSLKHAFEKLRELSENNIMDVEEVNMATALLFTGAAHVLKASEVKALSEHEDRVGFSDMLEKNKKATTTIFQALDVLDDIYLINMMPAYNDDDLFADIFTSKIHVKIKREDPADSSEQLYTVAGVSDSFVRVPSFSSLAGDGCLGGKTVGVQFLESNFNPFEYSNNSRLVESDVVGLAVKCDNSTLPVSGLSEPIDILARRENKSLDEMMSIFTTSSRLGDISLFHIYARRNMSAMGFSLDFNSTLFPHDVTLWLRKHQPPTPDTYDWTATLPVPEDQLFTVPWINETSLVSSAYQWLLPEDEIAITDLDVDKYNRTDYFIGLRFGSEVDRVSGEIVQFTLYVFETSCVYFQEDETHLWKSDGCRVGPMSNITHIHCRCDHLTKFAGFVPPNPLNIQQALSANILENPTGLILVLAVFTSYVMGVIWARKADRKDIAKAGVGLLPGHELNPRKDCQYLITVYTGFRGNAGTTAEITLVLYGSQHESPPLTLRDDSRCLFEQGSVDSFLVSTEEPLGVLTHLRVWHNNAGFSPSWYLSQIVVANRGTKFTTYFLSNRWFAIDEGDGKIDRIIPTSVEKDITKFHNLFLAKSSREMNDDHLWYSVAGRPARSPFTRVQRLSCCLTLLYSTMLTNIMFFGRGDDFDPPEPLRFAGLKIKPPISLPQLMIGIQSTAIILPVNLLIVFLFRHSEKQTKSSGKKLNTEPGRHRRPKKKETFTSDNPDTPSVWYPRGRPVPIQKLRVVQSSLDHDIEESSKTHDECKDSAVHGQKSLPWWGVFIGWLLVWCASFVAAFFTVLYTLSFGKAKSEAWACTFVTSFVTDLFLVQPVKLVLVAIIFALYTKKPVEDRDPPPTPTGDDEEYVIYNEGDSPAQEKPGTSATSWMRYFTINRAADYGTNPKFAAEERSTSPPDEDVLAEARAKSAEKRKRRAAVLEVLVFGLFVTVIMLTAYQERSPLAFYMTQNVKEQIVEGEFSEITDIESFWGWVEDELIPTTRSAEWYNGRTLAADTVLQDMLTHPLDSVQLRQLRLKQGQLCETPKRLQHITPLCTVGLSKLTEDIDDYTQGWIRPNETFGTTDPVPCTPTSPTPTVSTPVTGADCVSSLLTAEELVTPWKYNHGASLIDSFPYFGQHGTYHAGGYNVPLGTTRASGLRLATFLQQRGWLDEKTRAVIVELILYNPHANLFSMVTLVVEFTNLGAAYRGAEVVTLRLMQQQAILLLALRAVLAVFILFFMIKEAERLFSRPMECLKDFWSWVELLVIVIGVATLGVYFNAQSIIDKAAEQRTSSSSVLDLYKSAVNWFQVYTYLLALLICCGTLKFIRLLRFNSHVYALTMTVRKSSRPLLLFTIMAGIVLMAFTQMGNLLFGIKLQDYNSILSSLQSLCMMMLGSFDFDALVSGHWVLGPLMFFSYQVLMQFILLSMFMAILMDVYAEESQDPNTDDLQMVAFIRETTSEAAGKANRTLSTVGKRNVTKTAQVPTPDQDNSRKFSKVFEELAGKI
ncbi:polycystin-1-like protein 2 [Branchiostoma floridae x Branchiostoma japonicum]